MPSPDVIRYTLEALFSVWMMYQRYHDKKTHKVITEILANNNKILDRITEPKG